MYALGAAIAAAVRRGPETTPQASPVSRISAAARIRALPARAHRRASRSGMDVSLMYHHPPNRVLNRPIGSGPGPVFRPPVLTSITPARGDWIAGGRGCLGPRTNDAARPGAPVNEAGVAGGAGPT